MRIRSFDLIRYSTYEAFISIRRDFRRSILGTLWSTIGIAVAVAVLGIFFGAILQKDLPPANLYIPFLAFGVIIWMFVASSFNQSCSVTQARRNALRNVNHSYVAIPLTAVFKSLFIFIQNMLISFCVYATFIGLPPSNIPWLIGGLFLLGANTFWMALLVSLVAARFRDFPQSLSAGLYLVFLVTPIIWMEHIVGRFSLVFELNPGYHLLSLIRVPLLSGQVPISSWYWGSILLVVGSVATAYVYHSVRNKVPYWL